MFSTDHKYPVACKLLTKIFVVARLADDIFCFLECEYALVATSRVTGIGLTLITRL